MSDRWTLRDYWYVLTHWNEYFSWLRTQEWPDTYRPTLEDGSEGKIVMCGWGLWSWRGWSAQLHNFVDVDRGEPWHTHQADWGLRVILYGGYQESYKTPCGQRYRRCQAGYIGIVRSTLDHRIFKIQPEGCISIWIRGPSRHVVRWTYPSGLVRHVGVDGREVPATFDSAL